MKAITLWQPWASLVALGHKKIETRSWVTEHRGPLAIHASRQLFIPNDPEFIRSLNSLGLLDAELPRGAVLGWCNLEACQKMSPALIEIVSVQERLFGDYSPGRYMWMLGPFMSFEKPVPCRGKQGLWKWGE